MTQITINVEDKSTLSLLKRLIKELPGASLAKPIRKKKTGIEEAYEDINSGRVYYADSADDMFKQILG